MNDPRSKSIVLFLAFSLAFSTIYGAPVNASKKLIVIGMDGLDPHLLEKFMQEGDLPHFKALAARGSFKRLGTSNPPQSPVAWSCFISGCNPGCHDVFDFVVRDPSTYMPEIGMTETKPGDKKSFGALLAGLSGPSLQTRRKGKTFWDYLGEKNIPSVILRCPVTFPAQALTGKLLSGMGTPDIRGTQGIFSFFTEDKAPSEKEIQGRVVIVSRQGKNIETVLTGPRLKTATGTNDVTVPLKMTLLGKDRVRLTLHGKSQELVAGQWSEWFHVSFKTGFMQEISGACRFLLKSTDPVFSLYATAINIDPQKPAMPISYPSDYAKELFQKAGDYYTQGMPYDTWALNEGRLSEKEFLDQAYSIFDENHKSLNVELGRFQSGFLFCYFGITDLVQHMFWRYEDPQHPNRGTSKDPAVKDAIKNVYKKMDELLGEIEKKRGPETGLIILSDHGFGSFRRAVHVNSWLRDHGYLVLKGNAAIGEEFFTNVDWTQTTAYSLGFGGIYVNQFGREKSGVVYKGAETEQLKKELIQQLEASNDIDGARIIKKVYGGQELYKGPYAANAPDLYIGFNTNYRASWQTGLGAAPGPQIEDNMKMWGGDHLCDPSLVPGVLLADFPLEGEHPTLLDIGPTVLTYFGIEPDKSFEGRSLADGR